jgi:hypothetical protein
VLLRRILAVWSVRAAIAPPSAANRGK